MDDARRLSADEMVQHPWVADVETATDSNIHATVSNRLAEFTKMNSSKPRQKQPGVAVIATTALDKGSRYFDRGHQHPQQLQCLPDAAGEVF